MYSKRRDFRSAPQIFLRNTTRRDTGTNATRRNAIEGLGTDKLERSLGCEVRRRIGVDRTNQVGCEILPLDVSGDAPRAEIGQSQHRIFHLRENQRLDQLRQKRLCRHDNRPMPGKAVLVYIIGRTQRLVSNIAPVNRCYNQVCWLIFGDLSCKLNSRKMLCLYPI